MFFFLFLGLFMTGESHNLTTLRVFEKVPAGNPHELLSPTDMSAQGHRLFVSDNLANAIFIWDLESGKFLKSFGTKGQGPGEFNGPEDIATSDTHLLVFNNNNMKFQFFTLDGAFVKKTNIMLQGRLMDMALMQDEKIMVLAQQFGQQQFKTLQIHNSRGKPLKTLNKYEDKSYTYGENAQDVHLDGYAEDVIFEKIDNNTVLYANTSQPTIHVLDLEGNQLKEIKFTMVRYPITDELKVEFEDQAWLEEARKYVKMTVKYGESLPFFTRITPFGQQYVVFYETPSLHKVWGQLIDEHGKKVVDFKVNCGEEGLFRVVNHRVLAFVLSDDTFSLKELGIQKKDTKAK
jgi:hypothetical protein